MIDVSRDRSEMLSGFVRAHPGGWHHGDWETLLGDLRQRGLVGPGEEDAVGLELERARVTGLLEALGVRGLGPKRREAVAEAFPRLHDLRGASVEALSVLPSMNRPLAEAVVAALH